MNKQQIKWSSPTANPPLCDPPALAGTPSEALAVYALTFGTAAAVFIFDTFVALNIAGAVLYVAVVLLSVNFRNQRSIFLVGITCIALTLAGFLIQHGFHANDAAVGRVVVSLLAIVTTTLLATRIKATTEALRGQARLLDLAHDAIVARDMSDRIYYWNRGAEKLYGWTAEEAIGKISSELIQGTAPTIRPDIISELLSTGRWEGEIVHTRRNGTKVTVSSRWSLERDEQGQPTTILETDTDIETTKDAQERLAQVQAELAHVGRLSTLGELTASIAHEVNQPLAAIVTRGEASLHWLERDDPQIERAKQGIGRMIEDGRRASEVVRRTRALSRAGETAKIPVNLREIIDDAILLMKHELSKHKAILQLELADNDPIIKGDRVQLQQVLINLLMNALQATSANAEKLPKIAVRCSVDEGVGFEIEISDNGPGFAPGTEDKLFSTFFTTKSDGIGMGLSICRTIVEAHDGRIWASHNDQGGAAFHIALPRLAEGT